MAWRKRVLEYNPALKRMEYSWYHDGTGEYAYQSITEIGPILEATSAMYAATDQRKNWKGDMHHIATVPLNILFDLYKKTSHFKDKKAFRKWINDKDNRIFLIRPVHL